MTTLKFMNGLDLSLSVISLVFGKERSTLQLVHSGLFQVQGRLFNSLSNLYSTITGFERQTGTVRQMNDHFLGKEIEFLPQII